jgi:hypothetical protein
MWISLGRFVPIAPRTPWVAWVLGFSAGDGMGCRSFRWERLRPLGVFWAAALGREPRAVRELAGSLAAILQLLGLAEKIGTTPLSVTGWSASGPSPRRT